MVVEAFNARCRLIIVAGAVVKMLIDVALSWARFIEEFDFNFHVEYKYKTVNFSSRWVLHQYDQTDGNEFVDETETLN